jgi:hypothetical protein
MSGFRNASGIDFDNLFDPDVSGDGPSAVGFRNSDGSLLRYAAVAHGQQGAPTGFRLAKGADVCTLWAAKGTASYVIAGLSGRNFSVSEQALTNQGNVSASVSISINANGTWTVIGSNSRGGVTIPAPVSGTWLTTGGAGSQYDAQIDISGSGSSGFSASSSAPSWQSLAANQVATLTLPLAAANNTLRRTATASVRIRILNTANGAVVSDTSLTLNVATAGWA